MIPSVGHTLTFTPAVGSPSTYTFIANGGTPVGNQIAVGTTTALTAQAIATAFSTTFAGDPNVANFTWYYSSQAGYTAWVSFYGVIANVAMSQSNSDFSDFNDFASVPFLEDFGLPYVYSFSDNNNWRDPFGTTGNAGYGCVSISAANTVISHLGSYSPGAAPDWGTGADANVNLQNASGSPDANINALACNKGT